MKIKYAALAIWCFAAPGLAWDEVYGPAPLGDTCPTCPRSWTLRNAEGSWACRRVDNKPVCGSYQLNEKAKRARRAQMEAEIERADREFEKFTAKRKQDELEDRIERLENERRQ